MAHQHIIGYSVPGVMLKPSMMTGVSGLMMSCVCVQCRCLVFVCVCVCAVQCNVMC